MDKTLWRRLLYLLPLCCWIGVIFLLSFQPFAAQTIQPWLSEHLTQEQAKAMLPDVKISYYQREFVAQEQPFRFIELVVRKAGHVAVYAILGLFAYMATAIYRWRERWKLGGSLLVVLGIAALDEWNQFHQPDRTGSLQDVGVDLIGGVLAVVVIVAWRQWRGWRGKNRKRS